MKAGKSHIELIAAIASDVLIAVVQELYEEGEKFPATMEVINLEEQYVMPGLIDMHCHMHEGITQQLVASRVATVKNTVGMCQRLLHIG